MTNLIQRWKATFLATPLLTALYLLAARLAPEAMNSGFGLIVVLALATAVGSLACAVLLRWAGMYERDAQGNFVSGISGTGGGAAQFALIIAGIIWAQTILPSLGSYVVAYIVVSIIGSAIFNIVAGGSAPAERRA